MENKYCRIHETTPIPKCTIQCGFCANQDVLNFAKWCVKWRVIFADSKKSFEIFKYGGIEKEYKIEEIFEIYKKGNNYERNRI